MGWTRDLVEGLAEHIAGAGIGVWRPNGVYTAAETAIVHRAIPPAPDRLITLALYPVDNGMAGLTNLTTGIQIRVRAPGPPGECDDLADALFDLLDSAEHLDLGGIYVNQLYRQSYTSLGQDSSRRWERSENYYGEAERPTIHRSN